MAPQARFRVVPRLTADLASPGVQTLGPAAEDLGENRSLQAFTRQTMS